MITPTPRMPALTDFATLKVSEQYSESQWYAAYTRANCEKRVSERLGIGEVERFLPLYSCMRRWKDRRARLEMPLFPGYVFVRMVLRDRLKVPDVASLVGFDGTPAALPAEEIETLRASLLRDVEPQPHSYLAAGRPVNLRSGPLAGLTGIVVRQKNGARFAVSVELIQRSVSLEIDAAELAGAS